MQKTRKVGEILLEAGVIDEMQLKAALAEQEQWGRRLGVTLIKLGMVEEGHLIRALARQLEIPATSLVGKRIAPEIIALVPARVATEHAVLPLFVKKTEKNGILFLGMEDPSKLEVLDDLCFRTGLEIQPVMVGPSELAQAIDRYYARAQPSGGTSAALPLEQEVLISESKLGLEDDISSPDALPDLGASPSSATAASPPRAARPAASAMPPLAALSRPDPAIEDPLPGDPIEGLIPEHRDLDLCADELTLTQVAPILPEGVREDVTRAIEETERTRIVVKALTQLLVEKEIVSLAEIQEKVERIKSNSKQSE